MSDVLCSRAKSDESKKYTETTKKQGNHAAAGSFIPQTNKIRRLWMATADAIEQTYGNKHCEVQ